MVPKIHEVVYFQKIRPFINSWSLMCAFKTQADTYIKLFLTHSHTHSSAQTISTHQKLWTLVYCTLPWHAKQFIFSWLQQNTQTDDRAGWRALNSFAKILGCNYVQKFMNQNIDHSISGNWFYDSWVLICNHMILISVLLNYTIFLNFNSKIYH